MDYGKSFKHYRQNAKLTQKEAAELIGIRDYQLGNYETNRSEPSLDILRKMGKAYHVSIDKMIGSNNFKNSSKEIAEDDYLDMDELLSMLTDIVDKMNKAHKKQ